MKKFLSCIGVTTLALVSGTVVYLYINDKEVQNKINRAVVAVGDAVNEVKRGIETARAVKQGEPVDPVAQNQSWADEQWEALGI